MNNATIMHNVRQMALPEYRAVRVCQKIARELEDRMTRAKANPFVRTWSPEFGTPHELAYEAFCHSIVHAGK